MITKALLTLSCVFLCWNPSTATATATATAAAAATPTPLPAPKPATTSGPSTTSASGPLPLSRHILWNATNAIPPSWKKTTRATTELVAFHVALAHTHEGSIYNLLKQVSDVRHPNYANYLTPTALALKFSAPPSLQHRVRHFFEANNAQCTPMGGASLKCTGTATAVENIFHTNMYHFQNNNVDIVRHTQTISIPSYLQDDISFVTGLGQFFRLKQTKAQATGQLRHTSSATCGRLGKDCYVVPETIRTLYNVSAAFSTGNPKTSVGVAEFAGNYNIRSSDLKTFGTQVGSKTTPLVINHRGGQPNAGSQQVSEEAQLDIQYVSGLGDGVENWVWNQEHWMYALCMDLQNVSTTARPDVISMS